MKSNLFILTVLLMTIILSGCAPKYACKDTIPGTRCASLSEVYVEQVTGRPNAALIIASSDNSAKQRDLDSAKIVKGMKGDDQMPILRPPKVVRIWIAPWVDRNEDLNMDTYIYTEIRGSKWILGEKTQKSGVSGILPGNIGSVTGADK